MYSHKQKGFLIIFLLVPTIIFIGIYIYDITSLVGKPVWVMPLLIFIFGAMTFALISFYAMEIVVKNNTIFMKLGIGVIKKEFKISSIESIKIVKNKMWYGWGIRWIPGGTLYNVSGLDAVELIIKDGRKIRLGTDDPQELYNVIVREMDLLGNN